MADGSTAPPRLSAADRQYTPRQYRAVDAQWNEGREQARILIPRQRHSEGVLPTHVIHFEATDPTTMELPQHLLTQGGRYTVEVKEGSVTIWGNSLGLAYLGEVLIQCAKGGYVQGFHVHLPLDASSPRHGPGQTAQPGLTLFVADPEFA